MIYFLPSQIPKLKSLSHNERLAIVADSLNRLSAQRRVMLNIIKLLLITPLFLLLVRFEGWHMLPWLLLAGIAYPIIVLPVRHAFALFHLDEAIAAHKKGN
ncbi:MULTISPECIES: DUF6170 family protein [Pseudoalteromonas]|uniref:Uncharacterized protein n=1 Tax=Pseudoalteromonas ruthenica TaxID=151081 RepID=A0A5S3Z801_9GAMM|nr:MULTISPECIES: DUF6170 family protein [Pseudoalteromonas]MCF2863533.1 DUF6170 family protein [Pseudoalteromonas sp. CNAT2-18]MCG7545515.1 DUF6170 family protein [Pseudoalteromonas sp. MM17-2]MCG7558486.1 DUF6170 family protein [Pseudoalteromonas sp. CNAT2-18.1]QFU05460.1 hypothetical protein FIU82_10715 [Pseudoalteromonas sp. THAF3]TLX49228.1 hypothetical protein CWC31_17860 [Pseudoalteromonas ruthenica]